MRVRKRMDEDEDGCGEMGIWCRLLCKSPLLRTVNHTVQQQQLDWCCAALRCPGVDE